MAKTTELTKLKKVYIPQFLIGKKIGGATKQNWDFLLITSVIMARDNDEANYNYSIGVDDYAEIKGITHSAAYKSMYAVAKVEKEKAQEGKTVAELEDMSSNKKEVVDKKKKESSIMSLTYNRIETEKDGSKKYSITNFFQRAEWNEKTSRLDVTVTTFFKQDIASGKKLCIILQNYVRLKSMPAKTLYLLGNEFIDIGGCNFRFKNDFDEFCEIIGIARQSYGDSKIEVKLQEYFNEINKITDIVMSFKLKRNNVRGGTKITGIEFMSKQKSDDEPESDQSNDDNTEINFEDHLLSTIKMTPKTLKKLLADARNAGKDNNDIIALFEYTKIMMEKSAKKGKVIKQPAAYIRTLLDADMDTIRVKDENKTVESISSSDVSKGLDEVNKNQADKNIFNNIAKNSGLSSIFDAAKRV